MTKTIELNTGFIKNNKFELVEHSKEKIVLKAPLVENALNPYGMAHGGFLFSLGDTAMGVHCFELGHAGVTVNASINYVKPGKGNYITAETELIKEGKHLAFFKANLYDEEHNLIANMESTYYY